MLAGLVPSEVCEGEGVSDPSSGLVGGLRLPVCLHITFPLGLFYKDTSRIGLETHSAPVGPHFNS